MYSNCDSHIWLRTCQQEIIRPLKGRITGKIPEWINGKLFRNGPGASSINGQEFGHLFDNLGLLHSFTIVKGNVTYQSRYVNSEHYKKIIKKQAVITDFGTKAVLDPCSTIFSRVSTIFDPSLNADNSMITVYPFDDELFAIGESAPVMHKINKDTLETEKRVNMHSHLGIINHSSHPHIDHDGCMYTLGLCKGKYGIVHNIIQFPEGSTKNNFKNCKVVASVPTRRLLTPSYMHTFGLTKNYFVLVQQPLGVSLPAIIYCKVFNEPLIGSFKWNAKQGTRIDVISRKTGKLFKSFQTDSLFFLHIINQYELDNNIVIDICAYEDPKMLDCMYTEALKNMQSNETYAKMFRARPKRYVLPLNKKIKKVIGEQLVDTGCETPRINYDKYLGRMYRYFYAINSDVDIEHPGTILKVDVVLRRTSVWYEKDCYPSEPVFVPSPKQKELFDEDDGILLSVLVWGNNENKVGLLVLDAKAMKEIGRVCFVAPGPVPKCLHGWFIDEKLKNTSDEDEIAAKKLKT